MTALADEELEAVRRRGFSVAYRMLGSVTEAEDVAQEAMLRLTRTDKLVDEPGGWITTVATRLAIDHLRLARTRRESYIGPWLPEPLIGDSTAEPSARAELSDSLSQAFLVMLERLTPLERAAFLLRDVFEYDYARIAAVLDRGEPAVRQLVTRARRHLDASRPRFDADAGARDRLLQRFLAAAEQGDVEALEEMLVADAVFYSDGGGKVAAARRPLYGAARIACVIAKLVCKQRRRNLEMELVTVNGQPGRILRLPSGAIWDVLTIDVAGGRIQTVRVMRNPDKLAHIRARGRGEDNMRA